ncbi:MAG: endopeptidase La [Thiobacillaceae bacterium]|nr:endopeptidase La [Thiobacillaceae bacterium]MCX7673954.1 endopeptidase La [Thiobacillaceae bacterium]MDW8322818.1 endopeptidase La [Burkholderiales bacterium]
MSEERPIEGEVVTSEDTPAVKTGAAQLPAQTLPATLYLLPMTEKPFFPAQTLPLLMNEGPWLETVKRIGDTPHHLVGLVLVRGDKSDDARPEDFYSVGTLVRMHHPMRSEGKIQFIAEGIRRFRIAEWISGERPYFARVEYPVEDLSQAHSEEVKAYALAIINAIKELLPLNPLYTEELKFFINRFSPNEPALLADFAASLTTAPKEKLQEVLEAFNLRRRMQKVLVLVKKELEVARLQTKIRERVEEKLTKQQREFFLRQQLKAIQQELGIAKDDRTADVELYQGRVKKLKLPPHAAKRIDEELNKLSALEHGSPEYTVTRNYLEWLTSLPWGRFTKDKLDLKRARRILDQDHDGLDDVKQRIVEFLAVGAMKGEVAGSILLLVGPPGVGKTSIGRSIARALGRRFYRFSVGGMRDEAEIKGHRRTYIGALPGKFIQAIKEAESQNPVIMLDEVDKIGASYHGDPASALLEVLDPEQNAEFLDHYLDVRFDLSKVLFICTANQLDTIPGPLLDRMEVIRLAGYLTEEKLAIAKHHLWPRQLKKAGLRRGQVSITDAAIRKLIEGYAREAGVRQLEQALGRVVRKAVVKLLEGRAQTVHVTADEVEAYMGEPPRLPDKPVSGVGVVTGLAWTPLGGATLTIEATKVHTLNRGFKLTGKLGEVMKESAEIAYSYIASHLKPFKGDPGFFDQAFVHLHVPEGATPKDGPSAGITMATALLSLARNEKVARPLAMTGELTLTGQVLPVGGIREKVIAAKRVHIHELILPAANRPDFERLPDYVKAGLTVHFVKHYKDVARLVFEA